MSDEIRQLAHAVKALAESNQGIGAVLRAEVARGTETNRLLGAIFEQNAEMLELLRVSNGRHNESEKAIRVLQSVTKEHGQRIVTLEQAAGTTAAE